VSRVEAGNGRQHRAAAQTLRKKHQTNVDVWKGVSSEAQNLRDATTKRMNALVGRQEASTEAQE
jgi:hypothetical protein